MRIFLVHRTAARRRALRTIQTLAQKHQICLTPVLIRNSAAAEWKDTAVAKMGDCEAVLVFDPAACQSSENAIWEIEKAQELNKPLVLLTPDNICEHEIGKLHDLYHDSPEFESYFRRSEEDAQALYKMMVDSSEQLIQRRQTMNAFFITAIGSLMMIAGALTNFGTIKSQLLWFIVIGAFGIAGLFLCNSWRNLIDNYGKLNAAKFRVILRLERALPAQIFAAEWAALGKGRRPKKYRSFTATENLVPLWFALLLFCLVCSASSWYFLTH